MDAADALAPETGLFARLDPVDFGESVLSVLARAAARPAEVAGAWLRFGTALARVWPVATARWLGSEVIPPVPVDGRDRRFADPAWEDNPGYFALRQAYLAARRLSEDLLAAGHGVETAPIVEVELGRLIQDGLRIHRRAEIEPPRWHAAHRIRFGGQRQVVQDVLLGRHIGDALGYADAEIHHAVGSKLHRARPTA